MEGGSWYYCCFVVALLLFVIVVTFPLTSNSFPPPPPQAWLPSVPERFQLIGRIIYENVDDLMWDRLVVDVPEMVPREVRFHWKYF